MQLPALVRRQSIAQCASAAGRKQVYLERVHIGDASDSLEPACRIIRVFGPTDRHAEIGDSYQQSADSFVGQAAVVDRPAFDEEVRPRGCVAQLSDLRPEAASVHRLMKVSDGLAFDRGAVVEPVVARGQHTHFDVQPEANQPGWYAGFPLVNIGSNTHSLMLARIMRQHTPDREKKASLLAISQGEMA